MNYDDFRFLVISANFSRQLANFIFSFIHIFYPHTPHHTTTIYPPTHFTFSTTAIYPTPHTLHLAPQRYTPPTHFPFSNTAIYPFPTLYFQHHSEPKNLWNRKTTFKLFYYLKQSNESTYNKQICSTLSVQFMAYKISNGLAYIITLYTITSLHLTEQ